MLLNHFFLFVNVAWVQVIISTCSILVTAGVSIWIVRVIQRKITNERCIKDYLIREISNVQNEYRKQIEIIINAKENPRHCHIVLNELSCKINDIINLAKKCYKIDASSLISYYTGIQMMIEDDDGFTRVYRKDCHFNLTEKTISELYNFEANKGHVFYDIIYIINDSHPK